MSNWQREYLGQKQKQIAMVSFFVLALGAVWIVGAYFYFSTRKNKLRPRIIGSDGPLNNDRDVLIMARPVIVKVVFEDSQEQIDQGLIADVVVNYKDLVSGKYNFVSNNLPGSTGGSRSVKYKPKEEEKFSHDDESPAPYAGEREGGSDEGLDESEISGSPESAPVPESDEEIPETVTLNNSPTPDTTTDINRLNLNI